MPVRVVKTERVAMRDGSVLVAQLCDANGNAGHPRFLHQPMAARLVRLHVEAAQRSTGAATEPPAVITIEFGKLEDVLDALDRLADS
jgi:hypothetical protein